MRMLRDAQSKALHQEISKVLSGRLKVQSPADSNVASEIMEVIDGYFNPIKVPMPKKCQTEGCDGDLFTQNLAGYTRDGRLQDVWMCDECGLPSWGDEEVPAGERDFLSDPESC